MRVDELLEWGDDFWDDETKAAAALKVAEDAGVSGAVRDVLARAAVCDVPNPEIEPHLTDEQRADLNRCRWILEPFVTEFGVAVDAELERRRG